MCIRDSVTTTLNYDLQLQAYDALGSDDGAVVVMEPETGRILAMVSKPDFDPNTIADDWDTFVDVYKRQICRREMSSLSTRSTG